MARYSGVLCHLTSLPNGLADAERFIDLIANSGGSVWQMLPITPPDDCGSPYASPSAFAAHWKGLESKIFDMKDEKFWLEDWLLFDAIKKQQNGAPWTDWPVELRDRHPEALLEIKTTSQLQESFMSRWTEIRQFAKEKQVSLIGDLPIFIAHDSADVWAHRDLFLLDEKGMPEVVAGVPPDYFSEDGQKWGTVLYDWEAHRAEGWRWWKERMARMMRLFDIVRIDHFRGFHSAWAIPSDDENARNGEWFEGPGDELIEALIEVCGTHECIIAEDLGIIPPEVNELRIRHKLEGMSVLQFAFDDDNRNNPHHPNNITFDRVVYTGTHDNDTTLGWWNDKNRKRLKPFMKKDENAVQTMIRLALESPAGMAIIPLQDLMELDSNARMNTPGTSNGNWQWKFDWQDLPTFCLRVEQASS